EAPLPESPLAGVLREAVEGACAAVFRTSRANPELAGMGTTCISLLLKDGLALVGHVGDSRAYLVRDGEVWQLSEDHSLVNEQVRAGLLTEEEARHSRLKNIITRSVGFEEDVLVDVMGVETKAGDKFVLCSDGLSNLVEAEEIRDTLQLNGLDDAPQRLIQLANSRGGDDNITVVAVQRVE
ncbi:MAG TPA: protein phosphatase 2C domain-containing protein, partial [Myxococcales bacterium]|nr:protein phosphatase 2C domain-containing protein [Myxococcales bacterium]